MSIFSPRGSFRIEGSVMGTIINRVWIKQRFRFEYRFTFAANVTLSAFGAEVTRFTLGKRLPALP